MVLPLPRLCPPQAQSRGGGSLPCLLEASDLIMGLCPHDLTTSQRPRERRPSLWALGYQQRGFAGTQAPRRVRRKPETASLGRGAWAWPAPMGEGGVRSGWSLVRGLKTVTALPHRLTFPTHSAFTVTKKMKIHKENNLK